MPWHSQAIGKETSQGGHDQATGQQENIPQKYIVNPELLNDLPAAAAEESSSRFKPKRKRATTATSTAPKQKKKP